MKVARIPLVALVLGVPTLLLSLLASTPVSAQPPLILAPGEAAAFTVTGLGSGVGPKGAVCSPGGVWGDYVYIGESSGNAIEQIDFFDIMYPFSSGSPEISFPVGMVFGPGPLSDFGTFLYVASFGSGRISRVDPVGTPATWNLFPNVSDVTFDPTGTYSNELFAVDYYGPISTISTGGVITPFAPAVSAAYMRFGPGGAWGTGLYATNNAGAPGIGIIQIDSGGTPTLFVGGFTTPEQFDWATGGAFGGDMFASDFSTGEVWRVTPAGVRTVFLTTDPSERPAGITFCNGCLYLTSFGGGCWKICENAVAAEPTGWGRIKRTYGTTDQN